MARIVLSLCYIIVAIWMQRADCGLISQSSITRCEWGNSQEPTTGKEEATCKKKFVISMTLKSGQGEVEALYANVRQAYVEGASDMSTLKKPFRIEISKTQTIASYRAYYRGSVNGGPEEHVIYYPHPSNCRDGWRHDRLSCGKQKAVGSEEYAWDSQGFCCRCNYETRELRRPNATCERRIFDGNYHGYYLLNGTKKRFGSSAHCMMLSPIWFDVFSLDQPMMQYNITIRLLQFNGFTVDPTTETESANWTTISTFYLNPSRTVSRSKDGRVIAELQGDLLGARGPLDLTTKMLLVPSINVVGKKGKKPLAQNRDPKYWLLVDENMVDLSGLQCNKVGTSYSGFRRQPGRCHQDYKSCFTNQPLDLLQHDSKLLKKKKKGSYMLKNFGRVHPSTKNNDHSFIVRLIHDDLHNSFVTFRIDASDIQFVYNVGKGRIVDARTSDFKALTEVGTMYVEVENTGEIVAEFTVVLSECFGRKNLPGKEITIEPGRIGNVTFFLQSYKMFGEQSLCEVQLFDTDFNLLGTAKVDVKVKSNCFCYGACGCSCLDDGTTTMMECPTPPPIIIEEKGVFLKVFLLCLEIIGPQGIIGFFAIILLFFGCIKLCFGGIFFCRKSKAQEHFDNMKEKGVPMKKGPELVKCAGECRGAKAAKARYNRKVERIKKMGKTVRDLDDWRNTSFICTCHEELADIRFLQVIKALCFFYYILFVPFIWLGKKLWWGIFKNTAAKKEAAKKAVLKQAKKKGKLEQYGIIDLQAELKKMKKERNSLAKAENKPDDSKPPEDRGKQTALDQGKTNALGVTEIESNSKTGKKEEKQTKGKDAKKTTGDVVDSKSTKKKGDGIDNAAATGVFDTKEKGTLDDKSAKMTKDGVPGPGSKKTKDNAVDGKPSMKKKSGSKAKDPLRNKHGFGDEAQRDEKQFSAERKVGRSLKDKQHYPKSSSIKQKTYKPMKEHKPTSPSKSYKASSQPAHASKGSKSLSPDKHSSASIASRKEGSKQSIASKRSSHSSEKLSSESVKVPKKDSLQHSDSKNSLEGDNKSHRSKETSNSSGVSKDSLHSSHTSSSGSHSSKDSLHTSSSGSHSSKDSWHSLHTSSSGSHSSKDNLHSLHTSKSGSHSSKESSHSSHTSRSSSHSSHVSSAGSCSVHSATDDSSKSNIIESGSESHSEHTHKDSSSEHTSLSSIIPVPLSFATCSSSSVSVSSILPLLLTHSSSSAKTSSTPTIKSSQSGSQSSLSSHESTSSTYSEENTPQQSSTSHSEVSGESSSVHSDDGSNGITEHSESDHTGSHSDSDHTEEDTESDEHESTSDPESDSSEEHSSDSSEESEEDSSSEESASTSESESSDQDSTESGSSEASSEPHTESGLNSN